MSKHKIKLTKEYVKNISNDTNKVVYDNEYVMNYLKSKYSVQTFFCTYMQPEQEYLYEIIINGNIIVNLEFNTQTKEILCISEVSITEYLNTINNEQEKKFLLLVSEIARESVAIS